MKIEKPRPLIIYSLGYEDQGDTWQKAVRMAAHYATRFALDILGRSDEAFKLATEAVGDLNALPYDKQEDVLTALRDMGQLGWDPNKDLLLVSATPTVPSFGTRSGPNSHISRTVIFTDLFARPMAIVPLQGLTVPSQGNQWSPVCVILFGVSSDGGDIDRPIIRTYNVDVVLPG